MRSNSSPVGSLLELFGSMRFAISALSVVAIASSIGTLLRQREPYPSYVNQFGPFWADIFRSSGIYEVYNAWWFIAIMAFLVTSTSICVIRNAPKFLREMRSWQTQVRLSSLRSMPNRGEQLVSTSADAAVAAVSELLLARGFRIKREVKEDGVLLAARTGTINRLGYVLAHAGIVVVCLGGLADSELPLRSAIKLLDKSPLPPNTRVDQVQPQNRLPIGNPSYRANLFVVDGQKSDLAMVSTANGTYLQDLPFVVLLKKFRVEYYSTGMPKLFASDVEITNKLTGKTRAATIKVNEPLIEQGIALYQSSFDDGGSHLTLRALALDGSKTDFEIKGDVGEAIALAQSGKSNAEKLSLELTGLRVINVEDMKRAGASGEAAMLAESARSNQERFKESVATVLSPSGGKKNRELRNVGPSVQYKLRDAAGQAREFNAYMLPSDLDGDKVFLLGVRENANEGFRFIRLPADEKSELTEFSRIRQALADDTLRARAAARFAARASPAPTGQDAATKTARAALVAQMEATSKKALDTFSRGGLQEVARVLENSVPKAEQERAAEVFLRVLSGVTWDLWQVARQDAGLALKAESDQPAGRFLQLAQAAVSDSFLVGAPLVFQLTNFEQVQASVLQVTRSPGKAWVYLGSLMLVLGVFSMFYIRERRLWCYVQTLGDASSRLVFAMSAPRKTMMTQQEFDRLGVELTTLLPAQVPRANVIE